jgi:LPS export ABC transporter protein LptC
MVLRKHKKTKKISLILAAIILVTLGTIAAVFIGYRRVSEAPEKLLSSIKEGAKLSLGKIRQTATRDGKKEWSLEADSANYIDTQDKVVLKKMFVTYFIEDHGEVYLHADDGTLHTDTNDIEFSGNVVIKNEDYRLNTDKLSYEHERRIIFTDDPVHILGESAEISADSLEYDLKQNKIVLTGNVTATISRDFAAAQMTNKR